MRVISSKSLLNADGRPAQIGVIGSCRVHGPARALTEAQVVDQVAFPFNAYTHTPFEAKQYIDYCTGVGPIPYALHSHIFGQENVRPSTRQFAEIVASLDLLIIEIANLKRLQAAGFEVQQNYFSTRFVREGGKPYLDWWRAITRSRQAATEAAEALIVSAEADGNPITPAHEELLRTTRLEILDKESFIEGCETLRATHRAPVMFVSHFQFSTDTDALIESRQQVIDALQWGATQKGFKVYNPTDLVLSYGRDRALKASGKDIHHYEPGFELELGRSLLEAARDCLASGRRREPVPADIPAPLPDLSELDLDDLTELLANHVEIFSAAQRDVIRRRMLDIDPRNIAAMAGIATHALDSGRTQTASIYADRILRLESHNEDARHIQTHIFALEGTGDAVAALDTALKNGDADARAQICQKIIEQSEPGSLTDRAIRQRVAERSQQVRRSLGTDRPEEALRSLAELADLDPANALRWRKQANDVCSDLTDALSDAVRSEDHERTISLAGRMISVGAVLPTAHHARARAALKLGSYGTAVESFEASAALEPENLRHILNAANSNIRRGKTYKAARAYREVTAIAQARNQPGDEDLAREAKKSLRAVSSDLIRMARDQETEANTLPDHVAVHDIYEIATCWMGEDQAVRLKSYTANLRRHALLTVLELEKTGDVRFSDAARDFLILEPDNVRVLTLLGQSLSRRHDHAAALPIWRRLTELEPDDAYHHLQIARCADWMGMTAQMHASARNALERAPALKAASEILAKPFALVATEDEG